VFEDFGSILLEDGFAGLRLNGFADQYGQWMAYRRGLGKPVSASAVRLDLEEALRLGANKAEGMMRTAIRRGWVDWLYETEEAPSSAGSSIGDLSDYLTRGTPE